MIGIEVLVHSGLVGMEILIHSGMIEIRDAGYILESLGKRYSYSGD